jgi:hypothetical protein
MDYNSICTLAMDEIAFHSKLNLRPVSWELGSAAFQTLLEEAKILVPEIVKDSSPLFLGLPVKVMENSNPWTIKLISTDHP